MGTRKSAPTGASAKSSPSSSKPTRSISKKGKTASPVVVAVPPELDDDSDDDDTVPVGAVGSSDEDDDDDEEESSDDEGGVDEEGMQRLIKLLGDDPLDEYDQAQLRALGGDSDEEDEDEDESGSDEEQQGLVALGDSDEELEDDDATEEEAIPLDEVVEVDQDAVPQQKVEIDDQVAMRRIRENIRLDPSMPWTETLVVSYPDSIEVDVDDDLNRELAFYKQALHSATHARALATTHSLPFTRPSDYFAEMVKSDAHMERIRQRLLNESAGIKKSQEKRKEREGKKFGKQVQLEKIREREQSKKEMEERLKGLKRKRKDVLDKSGDVDDGFDVAVEDAIADRPSKRSKPGPGGKSGPGGGGKSGPGGKSSLPRHARDKKFGFGGAGRRSKENTRESTDSFSAGKSAKGSKGGGGRHKSKRVGKSRRVAQRSKN